MARLANRIAAEWRLLAGGDGAFLLTAIAGGTAVRLAWLIGVHGGVAVPLDASEASAVAMAFARTGLLADAYFPGQGTTAHLMPLHPLIAGLILKALGPFSPIAHLVLLGIALAQVVLGYLVIATLLRLIGVGAAAVKWGLVLLLLVPPFVPQEVVDFRYWEGAGAVLLAALNLRAMVSVADGGAIRGARLATVAALSALTFFVSPPVGLAIDLCWAYVALRYLRWRRVIGLAGACAGALGLILLPWALRNAEMLGAPVLTRSNVGIELALANYGGAISPVSPAHAFDERLRVIHPSSSARAQTMVARHGEVAYSEELARKASGWIAAHPDDFALLYLRHLTEFFFPRPWQMYFTGWEGARGARAITISLINLLGLMGLIGGLIARRRHFGVLALYVAALALPMAVFQPMPRYTYLLHALLALLAADTVLRVLAIRPRRAERRGRRGGAFLGGRGRRCRG